MKLHILQDTDSGQYYKGLHPTRRPGDTVLPMMTDNLTEAFFITNADDLAELTNMFPFLKAIPYSLEKEGGTQADLDERLISLLSRQWDGHQVRFCALSDGGAVYNYAGLELNNEDGILYINLSCNRSIMDARAMAGELQQMAAACGVNVSQERCAEMLAMQTCPTESLRSKFPEIIQALSMEVL